jgi:energy-coupling factor transporter ATP-binding protein EcfA2
MASFFISHSSQDNTVAGEVRQWLEQAGFTSVFLDFDPEQGIPAGRRWEDELYSELRKSDVVLFLATGAALESKWCHSELVLARSLGRTILPVLLEEQAKHPLVGDTQWIRLHGNGVGSFQPLADALRRLGIDRLDTLDWDPRLPPYPGLRAFDEDRAGVFYGRTAEIDTVLDRLGLRNTEAPERFVVVAGPSGSGKSSLVRAGVIPHLRRDEQQWLVAPPFAPGDRPLRSFAQALSAGMTSAGRELDWRACRERLAEGPDALADLVDDLIAASGASSADARVLLVIDQGEQLATQAARQERIALLDLVFGGLGRSPRLRVLATLRSEYLAEMVDGSAFAGNALSVVTVGRLAPEGLAEVIARPAERAGVSFEAGLVERMVEETTGGTPVGGDALPLLAFALRALYDGRFTPNLITWGDYERSGGVVAALKSSADSVFERLSRQGRADLVVPTLLQLVHVESDRPPTSRSLPRSHFADDAWDVIEAFVEARLLTTEGDEPMVHVAHEALMREWPRLSRAIESFGDELLTRSRLGRDAREWELAQREPSYLLSGKRLAAALAAVESPTWSSDPLVDEFVAVSQRRAQRQRRLSRTLGSLAVLVGIAVLGLAGWFVVDRARESLHRSAARSELVAVGDLAIDAHEVTDVQFGLCVDEGRCRAPGDAGTRLDPPVAAGARPVVMVDAAQAASFCHWIGRRLPTAREARQAGRAKNVRQLLRGGLEWTATKDGIAFKALTHDADTGELGVLSVNRADRDLDLTFRCAA